MEPVSSGRQLYGLRKSSVFTAQSKTVFLALPQRIGCPILRVVCEGWDSTALNPRPFPETSAYPTLRRKREGWASHSKAEVVAISPERSRGLQERYSR